MNKSTAVETANLNSQNLDPLLDERAAQQVLPMSLAWFRRERTFKRGPRFIKIGSRVSYRCSDLHAWISARHSGGEQAEAR